MGDISGAGGTTTSFSNTPQAKDDSYNYLEDLLKQNSTLYNSYTNTIFLDVMSNDLGGNAKTLFSVEDGDGNPITTDFDLITKDVNSAGVSCWEATRGGNWVRINNGKIEYRIADGSGVPGQGRSIDSLTEGQIFADEFVYAIKLGNGTLSEATVKINITGANDTAVIGVDGNVTDDRAVTEAGGVANGNPGDPSASGKLTISDADLGESSFQAPSSLSGTYGTFTFNAATGAWTYTLDNSRAATQGLLQGQIVTDTLTITSVDGGTTYPITVTIHGTNDAATITGTSSAELTESNAAQATGGTLAVSDPDAGESEFVPQAATVGSNGYGTFAIDAAGNWTYTMNGAHDEFVAGQDYTDSFTVFSEDGTDSQVVTVTIHGTNDSPVANADSYNTTEDNAITFDMRTNDTDADDGAVLSVTQINGTGILVGGSVAITGGSITLGADGQLTFTPAADFNGTPSFTYTVSDEHGATSTATVNLNVAAVNDAPINTLPATFATSEDSPGKLAGLSVADDSGGGPITVTLTVGSGTLTAANAGSVTVSGSGTASIVLTGVCIAHE